MRYLSSRLQARISRDRFCEVYHLISHLWITYRVSLKVMTLVLTRGDMEPELLDFTEVLPRNEVWHAKD